MYVPKLLYCEIIIFRGASNFVDLLKKTFLWGHNFVDFVFHGFVHVHELLFMRASISSTKASTKSTKINPPQNKIILPYLESEGDQNNNLNMQTVQSTITMNHLHMFSCGPFQNRIYVKWPRQTA